MCYLADHPSNRSAGSTDSQNQWKLCRVLAGCALAKASIQQEGHQRQHQKIEQTRAEPPEKSAAAAALSRQHSANKAADAINRVHSSRHRGGRKLHLKKRQGQDG